MTKLTDLPEFKLIITAAKMIAEANQRTALDCRTFAAAALALADHPEMASIANDLQTLQVEAGDFALDSTSIGKQDLATRPPMPLAGDFRSLLGLHASGDATSIVGIVRECLASSSSVARSRRPIHISCRLLLSIATKIAEARGHAEIDGATLAMACWCGYQNGMFKDRPGLLAHMKAHAAVFRVFAGNNRTHLDARSDAATVLPLAASVTNEMGKHHDDLFELVMIGTKVALFDDSRRKAAYHEAGHGVAFAILRPDIRIMKLSIKPGSGSAGEISVLHPGKDGHLAGTRQAIFDHAVCLLAGRAAEVAKFGDQGLNVGAQSDIAAATDLIWDAVTQYGLDQKFGPVCLPAIAKRQFGGWSDLSRDAEQLVRQQLRAAQVEADRFVRRHSSKIEAVADRLCLEHELGEDEVRMSVSATFSFRRWAKAICSRSSSAGEPYLS